MNSNICAKLTKKFFLGLSEGVYLASNGHVQGPGGTMIPSFAEAVCPPEGREEQWQRIKARRADGKNCYVYPDDVAFAAAQMGKPAWRWGDAPRGLKAEFTELAEELGLPAPSDVFVYDKKTGGFVSTETGLPPPPLPPVRGDRKP